MASSALKITAAAAALLAGVGVAQAQTKPATIKQTGLQTILELNNSAAEQAFQNAAGFLKGQPVVQQIGQAVGAVNSSSYLGTALNSAGPGNVATGAVVTGRTSTGEPITQGVLQTTLDQNNSAAQLAAENAAGSLPGQPVRQAIQQSTGIINQGSYVATGLNSQGPGF